MITRTTLAELISKGLDVPMALGRLAVDDAFKAMQDALARGEEVEISGYGRFVPLKREAREGRNPRTGEKIDIPASVGVSFHAHKALKDALNAPRRMVGPERVAPAPKRRRA